MQAGLRLSCLQTPEDRFSHVEAHMTFKLFMVEQCRVLRILNTKYLIRVEADEDNSEQNCN